jgi:hypothetical protein
MNPLATMVAGFVGVVIGLAGNFLIQKQLKSWQRVQWILEAKQAEWRELIGTLCESARCLLNNSPHLGYAHVINVKTGDQERQSYEADSDARKTIQDRIFIAKRVQEEKFLERWQLIMAEGDGSKFWSGWNVLHAALVKAAQEDLKI